MRETDRRPGETAAEYATRMRYLVTLIVGTVQSHAGIGIDVDDVIADLDWIAAQPDDARRAMVWDLQCRIDKVVGRMTNPVRLHKILSFVQKMSDRE